MKAVSQITCEKGKLLYGAAFRFNGIEVAGFKNTSDLRIVCDFLDSLVSANICHFIESVGIYDGCFYLELRFIELETIESDKEAIISALKDHLPSSIEIENVVFGDYEH